MEIHTFNKDREKVRVGVETMAKYVGCVSRTAHAGSLSLPCKANRQMDFLAVLWVKSEENQKPNT